MSSYDFLIVGGGINGAGIARELALRGFSVRLVEKNDFGSGTSQASSKLVHGGIRYLENGQLGLVYEACLERYRLLKNAPHLVTPLTFVLPFYKNSGRPQWMMKAGLSLYDLLTVGHPIQKHEPLTQSEVLLRLPGIAMHNLTGGAVYYDGLMDDARLCLETALQAQQWGAEISNYTELVHVEQKNGTIKQVLVRNTLTGHEETIQAKQLIFATGAWSNKVLGPLGLQHLVRPSKGVHVVVPRLSHDAVLVTTKRDNRVFFIIPWQGFSLIGTTDTDYTHDVDALTVADSDVQYLLEEAARYFPKAALQPQHVMASFAGLRPLIQSGQKGVGAVSREEQFISVASNAFCVVGGKYTTFRKVSEKAAQKAILRVTNQSLFKSLTHKMPSFGGALDTVETFAKTTFKDLPQDLKLSLEVYTRLVQRYGTRAPQVVSVLSKDPEFLTPLEGTAVLKGEVIYGVLAEQVKTSDDFLRRRTTLALKGQSDCKNVVTQLIAQATALR